MTGHADAREIGELASRFDVPPHDVEYVARGEWSTAYRVTFEGERRIARVGPFLADFQRDAEMGRVCWRGFTVPRVLLVDELGTGYVCVSEEVVGAPIESIRRCGNSLVDRLFGCIAEYRTHAPARTCHGAWPPTNRSGQSHWWQDWLLAIGDERSDARLDGWRRHLDRFSRAARVFDAGMHELMLLSGYLTIHDLCLVHADLLHRNVFVDVKRSGQPVSIIDWGSSFVGDPWYEYAALAYWARGLVTGRNRRMGLSVERFVNDHLGRSAEPVLRHVLYTLHVAMQQLRFSAFRDCGPAVRSHSRRLALLVTRARLLR